MSNEQTVKLETALSVSARTLLKAYRHVSENIYTRDDAVPAQQLADEICFAFRNFVLPELDKANRDEFGPSAVPSTLEQVIQVALGDDTVRANATLIAAAPDMLAALEQLLRWIRKPWGEDDGPENEYVIDEAYRAIAKATGKEPQL